MLDRSLSIVYENYQVIEQDFSHCLLSPAELYLYLYLHLYCAPLNHGSAYALPQCHGWILGLAQGSTLQFHHLYTPHKAMQSDTANPAGAS